MRKHFLLCWMMALSFCATPFAHAQNVEDMPLEDAPAIALPPKTSAPAPKPTAKVPAPKPAATSVAPISAATPVAALKPTPAEKPMPVAKPTAAPSAEDVELKDQLPGDAAPAPAANTASATPTAQPGKAATVPAATAVENHPPHDDSFGHGHEAHHSEAGESGPESETKQSWLDFKTTFKPPFMQRALVAGLLSALLCGFLGVYVVLRRVVFVGVALAELSSAGIALGLLLGFAPILGALVFMTLGVAFFSVRWSPRRVPHESTIGIVYLLALALGVLLIAKSAQDKTFMLTLMQGDVLLTDAPIVRSLAIAAALIGIAHAIWSKEFVLVSFDREAASTLGLRAGWWDFFLMATIGAAIAFSIHAVGVLLTSALLVLPAATALLLARSMKTAFLFAPLFAVIPVALGLHISFVADFPASAVIVVLSFAGFLAALAARREQ